MFPLSELNEEVGDCHHGGRQVLNVVVDWIKVYNEATVILCKEMDGFILGLPLPP